jgi:hypothetical protein
MAAEPLSCICQLSMLRGSIRIVKALVAHGYICQYSEEEEEQEQEEEQEEDVGEIEIYLKRV